MKVSIKSNPYPAQANSNLTICGELIYACSADAIEAHPNKTVEFITTIELLEELHKYKHLGVTPAAWTKILNWYKAIQSFSWYINDR